MEILPCVPNDFVPFRSAAQYKKTFTRVFYSSDPHTVQILRCGQIFYPSLPSPPFVFLCLHLPCFVSLSRLGGIPSPPRIPVSFSPFFDDSFSYLETQSWERQKHMATRWAMKPGKVAVKRHSGMTFLETLFSPSLIAFFRPAADFNPSLPFLP